MYIQLPVVRPCARTHARTRTRKLIVGRVNVAEYNNDDNNNNRRGGDGGTRDRFSHELLSGVPARSTSSGLFFEKNNNNNTSTTAAAAAATK